MSHCTAEMLSTNTGFDLTADSCLSDLHSGFCHMVLPLNSKASLGSGLAELLVLGYMGMLAGLSPDRRSAFPPSQKVTLWHLLAVEWLN